MSVSLVFLQSNSKSLLPWEFLVCWWKDPEKKSMKYIYSLCITFMKVTREPPTKNSADDFPTENRSLGRPLIQTDDPNRGSCPSIPAKCWSYLFCVHLQIYPENQHSPLKNDGKLSGVNSLLNFRAVAIWGPTLPAQSLKTHTTVWWFRNLKANHRLDSAKTLWKSWDKLPTSTG